MSPMNSSDDDADRGGHLWALVQEWMDSERYPPSQRKLARRVGISSSYLSQMKKGETFPNPGILERLAAEIHTPYELVLDAVLIDCGYRDERRIPRRRAGRSGNPPDSATPV